MPETAGEWLLIVFVLLPISVFLSVIVSAGLKGLWEMSIEELRDN